MVRHHLDFLDGGIDLRARNGAGGGRSGKGEERDGNGGNSEIHPVLAASGCHIGRPMRKKTWTGILDGFAGVPGHGGDDLEGQPLVQHAAHPEADRPERVPRIVGGDVVVPDDADPRAR